MFRITAILALLATGKCKGSHLDRFMTYIYLQYALSMTLLQRDAECTYRYLLLTVPFVLSFP